MSVDLYILEWGDHALCDSEQICEKWIWWTFLRSWFWWTTAASEFIVTWCIWRHDKEVFGWIWEYDKMSHNICSFSNSITIVFKFIVKKHKFWNFIFYFVFILQKYVMGKFNSNRGMFDSILYKSLSTSIILTFQDNF